MVSQIIRTRRNRDGTVEVYRPYQVDGLFQMSDRRADPQHNKGVNKFFVRTLDEVAKRLEEPGVGLWMKGETTGQVNLITRNIEIVP